MPSSRLTTKGQVTIPKSVRDALGVRTGDRVSFVVREDGVVELRPETVDLKDLYGILEHAGEPVSVEEMNQAVSGMVVESFTRSVKG